MSELNSFTNATNSIDGTALKPSTSQTLQKPPKCLEITFTGSDLNHKVIKRTQMAKQEHVKKYMAVRYST